jgi:hypothetical protein
MECSRRETGWRTDLLCAAASGHVADVQWSLETDVDVDAADVDGRTPLMWAAAEGHADVVRLLLDAKADGRLTDTSGWRALHWAIVGDHVAALRTLLQLAGPETLPQNGGQGAGKEDGGEAAELPRADLQHKSEMPPRWIKDDRTSAFDAFIKDLFSSKDRKRVLMGLGAIAAGRRLWRQLVIVGDACTGKTTLRCFAASLNPRTFNAGACEMDWSSWAGVFDGECADPDESGAAACFEDVEIRSGYWSEQPTLLKRQRPVVYDSDDEESSAVVRLTGPVALPGRRTDQPEIRPILVKHRASIGVAEWVAPCMVFVRRIASPALFDDGYWDRVDIARGPLQQMDPGLSAKLEAEREAVRHKLARLVDSVPWVRGSVLCVA